MPEILAYPHGTFCWVDLNSHDMLQAATWYGELLGWRVDFGSAPGGPPYGLFSLRERLVAGVGEMSAEMKAMGIPPLWNSYVAVDDAQAIERRVVELGGKVVWPCTKAGDIGTLAFFADPNGTSFAIWQPGTRSGAQLWSEPGAWCWNDLTSNDLGASRRFYGELFGWRYKSDAETPDYTEIVVGERITGGMIARQPDWGPPGWNVYFQVADLDAAMAAVKGTKGIVRMGPKTIEGYARFCVAADPQGGCFQLIEMQHRGA